MWLMPKIPKVAHFYWGEPALPWVRFLTLFTFVKYNPDWRVKYYVPRKPTLTKTWNSFEQKYAITAADYSGKLSSLPIEIISIDFEERFGVSNTLSEVHKSDYLRWKLLGTEGGLWSDMDIIYFKGMDAITSKSLETNTVVCNNLYGNSVGFMMGSALNPYYMELSEKAKQGYEASQYQSIGSLLVNRNFPTVASISKKYPECVVHNLPMAVVYAYNATMLKIIYGTHNMDFFEEASIGLHWYAGCLDAAKIINEVDEGNYLMDPQNVVLKTIGYSLRRLEKLSGL